MYNVDDVQAYLLHQDHCWVYNKLLLYQKLNHRAYPHGVEPTFFPVISKPITNLWGLGLGVERWTNAQDIKYQAGHLWMEEFSGAWCSWDIDYENNVVWHATAQCSSTWQATPSSWHVEKKAICEMPNSIKKQIEVLDLPRIKFNIETIDDKIIEVHLRWSFEISCWYAQDNFDVDVLWSKDVNCAVPQGWIDLRDETAQLLLSQKRPVRIAHKKR